MEITTVGLDPTKNVFQVYGVGAEGKAVVRGTLRRAQVLPFSRTYRLVLLARRRAVRRWKP